MGDIGLDKFLVGLIGIPGLTVCILAWIQPMETSERILTTAIGSTGLFVAFIRLLRLRPKAGQDGGNVQAEAEAKNEPN